MIGVDFIVSQKKEYVGIQHHHWCYNGVYSKKEEGAAVIHFFAQSFAAESKRRKLCVELEDSSHASKHGDCVGKNIGPTVSLSISDNFSTYRYYNYR